MRLRGKGKLQRDWGLEEELYGIREKAALEVSGSVSHSQQVCQQL